jgi:hypothetical protein
VKARPLAALLAGGALAATPVASVAATSASARRSHRRASHASRYVTGRLSARGYTVLVVGYNGRIASSRAQSFRVAAPDRKVTIQLVDGRGRYAGPVVLGGSGSKVIVGAKAPVSLGTIVVVRGKGYGRLARPLSRSSLDRSRWAIAKGGAPIGNGLNLGLVSSSRRDGGPGPGQDLAHVGIPNELDVASPGTHVLRALAPASVAGSAGAHAASLTGGGVLAPLSPAPDGRVGGEATPGTPTPAPGPAPSGPPPSGPPAGGEPPAGPSASSPWMSQMLLAINETINDDAAGITVAQIDAALRAKLNLKLLDVPSGASLLELSCNGLSFCAEGGSGQAVLEGLTRSGSPSSVPFPEGALDSASGLGEVVGPAAPAGLLGADTGGGHEFSLNPNATSAEIGSGDVITEVVGEGGTTTEMPTTLDFVFDTVPAIAAYSDGQGDTGVVSYPDSSNLGTPSNPIKVAAGGGGDVALTLTVFRPQRQGVAGAGEPAFMDIGHLGYEVDSAAAPAPGSGAGGSTSAPQCPTSSYSSPSPTLALVNGGSGPHTAPAGDGELIDSADDAPASADDTIGFTIDLTQCLAAKGVSLNVGQQATFDLSANSQSSSDHANQTFVVERVR